MNGANPQTGSRRRWKDEPLVLFVEGYSDLTFYAELMEHLGHFPGCFIQDLGGKGRSKLREEAILLLKPDNLAKIKAVAVLLDADDDADGTFSLARKALKEAIKVDVPRHGEWTLPNAGNVRYGIFIVGGANRTGEVETLAWSAWSARQDNGAFRECVEDFVKCAEGQGRKIQSIDKVRIGAVLSVLNEDDPRLGPGARAKAFDFNAEEFRELREFLQAMGSSTASAG